MIDLRKGDCLEIMKTIESGSIDAIITDPPYGTTACKWDSVIDFKLMWLELNRIIKPNGAIVLFGSEPFSSALTMSNIKNYKYDIIYEKSSPTNPFMAKKQIMKRHENVSIFYGKQCVFNPQMIKRKKENKRNNKKNTSHSTKSLGSSILSVSKGMLDLTYPSSIQKFNRGKTGFHPTQKPVALMEYLIKTYTNENETVLDFTMGSGSTLVACQNLNRNGIGIEQDETYFKIASERIENNEYKLF